MRASRTNPRRKKNRHPLTPKTPTPARAEQDRKRAMPDTSRGDGPELPEVQMHLHRPGDGGIGIVTKTNLHQRKPRALRHLEIDVSKTRLAGQFRSGQSAGVCPPGWTTRADPPALYSIASPSRGEDGRGQRPLHHRQTTHRRDWVTHRLYTGWPATTSAISMKATRSRSSGPTANASSCRPSRTTTTTSSLPPARALRPSAACSWISTNTSPRPGRRRSSWARPTPPISCTTTSSRCSIARTRVSRT